MSEYKYDEEVQALQDDFPIGTVVKVETTDGERYRARVTGYNEIVNDRDGRIKYTNPGARLCVSTNPLDAPKVEDSGIETARAAQVPRERIHGVVDG